MSKSTKANMKGLTLVELLISVTLSVLLLTGVVSIFMANQEAFDVGEKIARVQEGVRFASTRITNDVSTAGFMGCLDSSITNFAGVSTAPPADANGLGDFSQMVVGGEAVGPNGSDRLTVHYAQVDTGVPYNPDTAGGGMNASSTNGNTANISSNPAFALYQVNDIVTISDCKCLLIGTITAVTGNSFDHSGFGAENDTCTLGAPGAVVPIAYLMDGVTYQLDPVAPVADGDGLFVSNLVSTRLGGPQQTILSGVEDFQVEYGIDANDDELAEAYLDWGQVVAGGNQGNVLSVRVTITMNSGKPVQDPFGQDPSYRKSSTFTVVLRNQGV